MHLQINSISNFIYFTGNPSGIFNGQPSQSTLSALVSQHRLLELSRFGLRGYDLAQQMLTQQGAVSKLLGKSFFTKKHYLIVQMGY